MVEPIFGILKLTTASVPSLLLLPFVHAATNKSSQDYLLLIKSYRGQGLAASTTLTSYFSARS